MIQDKIAKELQESIRGELLLPGSSNYDAARSIWNGMIDRKPAMIARCLGVEDVITCVNFARDQNLPLAIKGGGHNISGLAVCNDGLMLDMSQMRGVWVDRWARVARAQAGCILGDVDHETQIHGLAAVLGFVSQTGIAGLTLGGGFGYLTRQFGWTSDNLLSAQLVTAEGRVVQASESENSDLFWALRGGGGNFGVATGFETSSIQSGQISWRVRSHGEPNKLKRYLTYIVILLPRHHRSLLALPCSESLHQRHGCPKTFMVSQLSLFLFAILERLKKVKSWSLRLGLWVRQLAISFNKDLMFRSRASSTLPNQKADAIIGNQNTYKVSTQICWQKQ